MTGSTQIHLSDFRVALGELVALDDLTEPDVVANRSALRGGGASCAAVIDGPSVNLAAEVLLSTSKCAGIASIIYATDDLAGTAGHEAIGTLLRLSGCERTPASIVTGNGCANLGFAMVAAAGHCRETGPVTVVTSDRAAPGRRVQLDSMSLLSDAAGACTVTEGRPPGPCFQLVAIRTTMQAAHAGPRTATVALRSMIDGVGRATRAALDAAGWAADDVAGMAVGEYSAGSRRFLAHASGISRQLLPGTRAGHCHSTDMFRSLAQLTTDVTLPDDAPVLALASGRRSWSVFALRYQGC